VTIPVFLLLAALAAPGQAPATDGVLAIVPAYSLARVSERLAHDPSIREVTLASGTYRRGWVIPPLQGADPGAHPLLIRPADGADVVFDGARPIEGARPVRGRPGVFTVPIEPGQRPEAPKLWEPDRRVRYLLAADLDAVERFPGSYLLTGRTISFHTSDGQAPGPGRLLASSEDFGILVQRPHVTVRGLVFRNFTARDKWSAGVQARADHVSVEGCQVSNASFGYTFVADDGALVDSLAQDVGGGVYLAGKRARVEGSRFLKERDRFVIPTYFQDDCAIQAYYPAESGTIRGNLTVGFDTGILIKANPAPWLVEENTLVAAEGEEAGKYGFIATEWHPESAFRRNVVAGYDQPVGYIQARTGPGVERNCYDIAAPKETEPGAVFGDPRFVDPGAGDFRLAEGSPCLAVGKEGIGAPAAAATMPRTAAARGARAEEGAARVPTPTRAEDESDRKPRDWHVSPAGRDGAEGKSGSPLRSIQEAADRARAGDTILLHPGIYTDPVVFDHGGSDGRPITLRATDRWKAILDGARRHDDLIRIEKAPFVVVRDLEVRWFKVAGIRVSASPDVRVEGCRIWNAHYGGNWPEGDGVQVDRSPRFTGAGNVLYNQERGFQLLSSPGATIVRNTAAKNLYGGVVFVRSIEGTTCTHNSFAYQGNDAISIVESEGGRERLRTLTLDHNNYGQTLVDGPEGESLKRLVPRKQDQQLKVETKAIVYFQEGSAPYQRFRTMEAWREFSSLDTHSIFADPLYLDAAHGDFRIDRKSPNRRAGANGGTIGALTD
jgi:nitrous oxidase accessory protein NosD